MSQLAWAEYDKWNEALAEELFSLEHADLPAYVDVDATVLARVASKVGAGGSPAKALASAVRETLGLDDGPVLAVHMQRYQAWRKNFSRANTARRKGVAAELPVPPVVGLLAVLVLAAESMGAGAGVAPNAYYPRLAEVLELSSFEANRLKARFPHTEIFWRGLNEYLEAHEGSFGLPTAYSLSWRYVGLPQSQAVIRAADRRRLPDFFSMFGLVPGSEMIPADLERLLDLWIGNRPSPVSANLQALWKGGKARERVAGVAAVELSLWDGSRRGAASGDSLTGSAVQLTALIRQGFGSRALELSFAARLSGPSETGELVIQSAAGSPTIGVVPAAGGRVRPVPGSRLDPASMAGAIVELRDPTTEHTAVRRPRRVVPLRRDELLGVLTETERVQLADDAVLLVKDEPKLVEKVLQLLGQYGHYGAISRAVPVGDGDARLVGLPDGWILIEDVQIYAIPQDVKLLDLHVLVPLTTAQLNFSGGLKLPGRIRKWSSLHPPEIRAAVDQADSMRISLTDLAEDGEIELENWEDAACAMVVPLDGCDLEDGDYQVALYVNGETDPISQTTLRLRSGDTPDAITWETCTRLNYELDKGALSALSAVEVHGGCELVVDGLLARGERAERVPLRPVRSGIGWSAKKVSSGVERPIVVLGTADAKSCVVTGAHYIVLPDWHGGKPTQSQIQGVCKHCGLRKTLPAKPKWKKAGESASVKEIQFSSLPSHADVSIDLDSCLDALVHVGGGAMSALERVASQAQGGALFLDQFLRSIETLGHVDVRRDDRLAPVEWEANPAFLAETCGNGLVLAGVWSAGARRDLERGLAGQGGMLVRDGLENDLSSWFVRGTDPDGAAKAVEAAGLAVTVVPDAARRMLAALPPLSAVEAALGSVPVPMHSKATIFDIVGAGWVTTPGVAAPGAYRVEQSFKTVSIWVDQQGAVDRTCKIGSVQLVKHLAGLHAGRPLLGYLEKSAMLLVPMGAELPGLYGRVASLCSGQPPVVSAATRTVAYRNVPRDIADGLNSLLSS